MKGAPVLLALAGLLLPATVAPTAASGQGVAERLRAREGRVVLRIPLRAEVRVCERGVRVGERRRIGWEGGDRWEGRCSEERAAVVTTVASGRVVALELEPWPVEGWAGEVVDDVSPEAWGRFLTGLPRSRDAATAEAAEDAVMISTLLPVPVWPALLDVARDRAVTRDVRKASLFWVGQVARERVTEGLEAVAADDSEEMEVREAAVFALSQRDDDPSLEALMEVARSARHGEIRRAALFWLAQSDDARVPDFFERILISGS